MEPIVNGREASSGADGLPPARSKASKWTIWISLGGIALVGGTASYLRALGVIQAVDGRNIMAVFEAALADPTIAAASVNIVDAHRRDGKVPKMSVVSIAVAVVVTLGANVVYGRPDPLPTWLVNVWPPIAFMLAFESLMSYLRRGHSRPKPAADSRDEPCPHGLAADVEDAVRQQAAHIRDCEGGKVVYTDLASRFGLDRKRVADLVKARIDYWGFDEPNGSAPDA